MSNLIVCIIILVMLGLERFIVTRTTRIPRCQEWYRTHAFMHPNSLSIARLPMGLISIFIAQQGWWAAATLWFSFWMITDVTDGTIARNCGLETETGKWLDPLSDKCMYFPALIYMSCGDILKDGLTIFPLWLTLIFIILDILGQTSRLFVKKKAANSFGKAKTALVTVLLSVISLDQIQQLRFGDFVIMNPKFVLFMMVACTLLAFLSFYCKVIPDIWYANTLIILNLCCGIAAVVLSCLAHVQEAPRYYVLSFILVFIGQFFDLFDGRLAQRFGTTPHGDYLDNIADAASYGLGIASLIFFALAFSKELIHPILAAIIALIYLSCVVYNLMRYHRLGKTRIQGHFCGLPLSGGAFFAGSGVLVCMEFIQPFTGILAALLVLIPSALMLTKLPYLHIGQTLWPNMPRAVKLILGIVILVFVCFTTSKHAYRYVFVCAALLMSIIYAVNGIDWKYLFPKKSEE